ncbi:TonB-dependent receptor [uncultured Desulfovibrio sp.]|uniref:TonB-dependent receptor plug domain-containing protein n=1 Tax=uncultured Desulfovibrio sp. TaxID=167968 RepID=UPI002597EBF7|nr:TonB-dependent receptor [uncultured Desulfovibrio sp.]
MKKTLLLGSLLLCSPAFTAQAADDNLMQDVFLLDPVTVTGQLEEEKLDRTTAIVVERNRSNNVADYLVRDPEISFKRKAAFGDSSDIISIRGMESKRIMLNLDGRNIGSTGMSGGNYIDFGTIPLDNIERIEVIKGGSSVEYGNSALGGVINARTRKPTETPYLSAYATMGGWNDVYDFHNVRGSYAQKFRALGVSLGLSHQHADPFLRNNYYNSFHFNPKVYLDLPWRGALALGYSYSETERGLIRSNRADGNPSSDADPDRPGFSNTINSDYPLANGESFAGGSPTPSMTVIGDDAHWTKYRHLLDATYRQEFLETGFFELMAFKNYENRREKNYADVAGRMLLDTGKMPAAKKFDPSLTRDGDLVLDRNVVVDTSYGFKAKTGGTVMGHQLLAGFEYKLLQPGDITVEYVDKNYNKAGPNKFTGQMDSQSAGRAAQVYGAFLADKFNLTDALTVDVGLRLDSFVYSPEGRNRTLNHTALSPKLMLTYAFTESQSASLALYQNYRTPTIPELYWNSQASSSDPTVNVPYLKGKDIKPETARGADLAYKYAFENKGFVKLFGFYYNIEDYIVHKAVYVDRPQSYQAWAAYNTDAEIYGATLSGSYALRDDLQARAAVTWQDSRKRNDPADPDGVMDKLEYVPNWKATLGAVWKITDELTLDTALTYVGPRQYYVNTAKLDKGTLHDYATLGASLSYRLDEHLTLEAYADNITNTQYAESWGYPALGFNAGVSLKWEL